MAKFVEFESWHPDAGGPGWLGGMVSVNPDWIVRVTEELGSAVLGDPPYVRIEYSDGNRMGCFNTKESFGTVMEKLRG